MNDIALPQIHVIIMPPDELGRRPLLDAFRQHQQLPAVEGVVLAAVAEVFFDPFAYFHMQILGNGKVAPVKERMDVLP
jgi:hypothetical protein